MYFIYSDFRDELRRKGVNNLAREGGSERIPWLVQKPCE
jgi:hypothetical protein